MQKNQKNSSQKHPKIVVIVSAAAALLGTLPLAALAGSPSKTASPKTKTASPKTDFQLGQRMADKSAHGPCAVIAKIDGELSPVRQQRLSSLGADITRHLGFIHSVALTLPTHNLQKLAALPFVSHLSYDGEVKKCDEFTVASSGAGAAYQSYGLTGLGIGVAVMDSGIRDVDDMNDPVTGASRIVAKQNFVPDTFDPTDWCGHGTHVSGIIGGGGQDSTGSQYTRTFYGIARRTNLINVRVLDNMGKGSISSVIAGLQWVIANKNAYNIRVINLSLGHPVGDSYKNDPLCQAVESAWNSGIVIVCAAGNNGRASAINTPGAANEGWGTDYGSIQSPANDPYVITVGATKAMDSTKSHDKIATYSSRGPSRIDMILKPDIIAPGNKVISLYAWGSTLYTWNTASGNGLPVSSYQTSTWSGASAKYFILSGTSMAAPVVSGAAALMLQANPNLSPDTIKARLMVSADKWADPSGSADACTYGAGYLNIPNALASTVTPTQSALSPQLSVVNSTIILDPSKIGGANIWGSKAISGVSAVYGSKAISGSKAVSGVSTVAASKALSGSSVWTDKALSGSSSTAVDLSMVALKGE